MAGTIKMEDLDKETLDKLGLTKNGEPKKNVTEANIAAAVVAVPIIQQAGEVRMSGDEAARTAAKFKAIAERARLRIKAADTKAAISKAKTELKIANMNRKIAEKTAKQAYAEAKSLIAQAKSAAKQAAMAAEQARVEAETALDEAKAAAWDAKYRKIGTALRPATATVQATARGTGKVLGGIYDIVWGGGLKRSSQAPSRPASHRKPPKRRYSQPSRSIITIR